MVLQFWRIFVFSLLCFRMLTTPAVADEPNVEWEITNRFSPFEALPTPNVIFDTYRITKDDHNLIGWHARLDKRSGGVQSPYANALKNNKNLHWNPVLGEHRNNVLKYVRKEKSADTTITIKVRITDQPESMCKWSKSADIKTCHEWHMINIPLSGGEISVEVDGTLITRKIKPKHKVIVALGDSYGSGEGNPDVPTKWKNDPWSSKDDLAWLVNRNSIKSPPKRQWVDDKCHRSFFSHQSLTALQMASKDPHLFVSFLHYACSGAEIFDGVLAPQWQAWGDGAFVPYSQVNAALRDLCKAMPKKYGSVTRNELSGISLHEFYRRGGKRNRNITGTMLRTGDNFDKSTSTIRAENKTSFPRSGLLDCPEDNIRKPDHIFLSIGGNDIGFADLVRYFVVPVKFRSNTATFLLLPKVCPQPKYRVNNRKAARYCKFRDVKNGYHAGDLIGQGKKGGMERRYELLFNILKARFHVPAQTIIMPQVPDPLRIATPESPSCKRLLSSDLKVKGSKALTYDPMSPWNGLKTVAGEAILKKRFIKKWQFNITEGESLNLLKQFDDFRVVLSEAAVKQNITFVCDTRDAFVGRGWWAGEKTNLPNHTRKDGSGGWSVSTWNPYKFNKRGRAIRTGNDTVLTQAHPDTAITGAAHPNLIGHTLVADIVFKNISAE